MNREREEDHQQKRHQASLQDVDITAQNDSGSKRITNRKDTCDEQRKENDAWRLRVHFSGEQGPEKDRQPAFDEKENRIGIGDASDGPVQERIAELELKGIGMGYARPEELFVGKPVGSGAPSQRLEQNDQARAGEKQEIPLRWLGIEPDDATGGEEEEKKMVNHLNRPIRSGTISRKPRRSIFSRTNALRAHCTWWGGRSC